jgi:hypothetical protein
MDEISVVTGVQSGQAAGFALGTNGQRGDSATTPSQPASPQPINIVIGNNNVVDLSNGNSQKPTCAKTFALKYSGFNKYGSHFSLIAHTFLYIASKHITPPSHIQASAIWTLHSPRARCPAIANEDRGTIIGDMRSRQYVQHHVDVRGSGPAFADQQN